MREENGVGAAAKKQKMPSGQSGSAASNCGIKNPHLAHLMGIFVDILLRKYLLD